MDAVATLSLPNVTLCCVDTRSVPLALSAVRRCMQQVQFGDVFFMGPEPGELTCDVPNGIRWVTLPALQGIQDYNRVMLRDVVAHVQTSHVLIVQWDGFITDIQRWQRDFLDWDYIGAPWYHGGHPGMVGNGGFSLRSRRLLQALLELPVDLSRPEDMEICVHQRATLSDRHGIQIAPLEIAQSFACEYGRYRPSFGFHGMHNFAHVFSPAELADWLSDAPREIIVHQHARKLAKSLMAVGRGAEARNLLRLRARYLGWTPDQCNLMLRSWLPARADARKL